MEGAKQLFGTMGIVVGGIALILAQFHFWAGPLAPQPTMDSYVAEKAAALRQKTLAALSGKDLETDFISTSYNADQIANILTALFGGIACILGVFSFARKESIRFSGGAVALGVRDQKITQKNVAKVSDSGVI